MAPLLVGWRLVADAGTGDAVTAVIVEVEAYGGADDPASHAARGVTPRCASMAGPPGHAYVYLSYGMHHCLNIVTGPIGPAAAVLVRAAAVETGEAVVRHRRRPGPGRPAPATAALLRGPGNLCRGLAIGLADDGADLLAAGRLQLLPSPGPGPELIAGGRVGIRRATERLHRFAWAGHPAVSAPVPRPASVRAAGP